MVKKILSIWEGLKQWSMKHAKAWKEDMGSVLAVPQGPRLSFNPTTTPLKRKREIDEGAASYGAGEVAMSARRRVFLEKDGEDSAGAAARYAAGAAARYVPVER